MEIIDSQIHPVLPARDLDATIERQFIYEAELALASMNAVGVDAALLTADRRRCEVACALYPERFGGIVQFLEPDTIADPETEIHELRSTPGLLGFRIVASSPIALMEARLVPLLAGRLEPYFAAAERHGVPMCISLPMHLEKAGRIASDYPGLNLIIDHLGMLNPPRVPVTPALLDTLPDLLALARFPNVAVKFSGVPSFSMEPHPFRDLWPKLHQVVNAFGPERLLWGSDFTRIRPPAPRPDNSGPKYPLQRITYMELVAYLKYTDELSETDKEWMFGLAARRWLRWPKREPAG